MILILNTNFINFLWIINLLSYQIIQIYWHVRSNIMFESFIIREIPFSDVTAVPNRPAGPAGHNWPAAGALTPLWKPARRQPRAGARASWQHWTSLPTCPMHPEIANRAHYVNLAQQYRRGGSSPEPSGEAPDISRIGPRNHPHVARATALPRYPRSQRREWHIIARP